MVLDANSLVYTDYISNSTTTTPQRTLDVLQNITSANYSSITSTRAKGNSISLIQNSQPRILGFTYSLKNDKFSYSMMNQSDSTTLKDNYIDESIQIVNEVTTYANTSTQENITIITTVNGTSQVKGTIQFKKNAQMHFDVQPFTNNNQKMYNLYVLVNIPQEDTKLYLYTIKNDSLQLSTINLLEDRCGDDLQVTNSIIVVQCTQLKKIKIYRTLDRRLIKEILLTNGEEFYQQQITGLLRAKSLMIISRDIHNYVFFSTKLPQSNSPNYINVVEVIVLNNGLIDPITTIVKPFFTTFDKFYLQKLLGQYILRVPAEFTQSIVDLKIYPMCFLDQYLSGSQCLQCPPNEYSLYYSSTKCYGWDALYGINNTESYKKLNFLLQNAVHQISVDKPQNQTSSNQTNTTPSNNNNSNATSQNSTSSAKHAKKNDTEQIDEDNFNIFDGYTKGKQLSIALLVIIISCSCCSVLTGAYCLIKKRLKTRRRTNIDDVNLAQQITYVDREVALRKIQREVKLTKVKQLCKKSQYNQIKKQKNILDTCGICCEEFIPLDKIRVTQCYHIFHSKCLLQWVKHKINANLSEADPPDCPYCKWSLLEPKPIEQTEDESESPTTKQNNISGKVIQRGNSLPRNMLQGPQFELSQQQLVISPQRIPNSEDRVQEVDVQRVSNARAAWTEESKEQQ